MRLVWLCGGGGMFYGREVFSMVLLVLIKYVFFEYYRRFLNSVC